MTVTSQTNGAQGECIPANRRLLPLGLNSLKPLNYAFDETAKAVQQLADVCDKRTAARAMALKKKLDEFEPSVTLVGQVKAGKTALTNVLVGSPGLLPSDVNPWTSVVTTLHINPKHQSAKTKALFDFFAKDEWDKLVVTGGRLGELAERAGADDEMRQIQEQIAEMQAKTKKRLGDDFEELLGQQHRYDYYDSELVERYVCLGEEESDDVQEPGSRGHYADVTKSAELFVDLPEFPGTLCLRDTPGVNDTFMVREQITIRSVRDSEICVVVLSAHQALTTMDMALIRLISNLEKRQVILFVNRIDELPNPALQVPEIEHSIRATLKSHNAPDDCSIIFGSAKWAEAALTNSISSLPDESRDALIEWAQAAEDFAADDVEAHTWYLSGVPALMDSVYERVREGSGQRTLEKVRKRALNLANQARAATSTTQMRFSLSGPVNVDKRQLKASLQALTDSYETRVQKVLDELHDGLMARLEKAEANFVKRATDALISHLQKNGEHGSWQYKPDGLRLLLRAGYLNFSNSASKNASAVYASAASDIEKIYVESFGVELEGFHIEPPVPPRVPPPVVLGKTIALDLQSTWWRKWWQKRKGFEAFAADYARLIQSESGAIIQELKETQVNEVLEKIRSTLREFIAEQNETLIKLAENPENADQIQQGAEGANLEDTQGALGDVLIRLERVAA
ncbi:dynamin family protein [Parasulfitobacter algicola]|uniref:Dynamin family protein n=1 Tax=Parasulfitobacter algicola TaxID=2614809 RepID=A0ABX2IUV5_9RHOB|nr:dynamin family protein [Sulfitobacter algicola]NSX56689.1 dynamin family protein [Sulfitobacter algicola]